MLPAGKGNSAQQLGIQHQQTLFAALLCLCSLSPGAVILFVSVYLVSY
jgi:hypothetical protein